EVTGLDEPRAIPQKSWTGRLTVQKNIRSPSSYFFCAVFPCACRDDANIDVKVNNVVVYWVL
ncbi:hypothetical protein, partial [Bifidobacterium longum]|uniref:hypothetical protein n=1 Tax=Bifidobacterium longum TaxID=216816 RepID=UPI001E63B77B